MRNWGAQQRCARGPRQGLWGQSGAWLRCPRELAGPGPTTSRRTQPHASTPSPTGVKGARGRRRGAGGRRGLAGQHTDTPTDWRPPRGLRGLAGLRVDAPSEARGADGRSGRAGRAAAGDLSGNKQQAERPPLTGAPSSPARRTAHATPATPVGPQHHTAARQPNTPRRHNKTARPHRGRAAQPISVTHRRITTMSGSPRPLSWRTLEMPSLAATSFAVPSMRGSS